MRLGHYEHHSYTVSTHLAGCTYPPDHLGDCTTGEPPPWTVKDAYHAGVLDGHLEEAHDRDSKEPWEPHTMASWEERTPPSTTPDKKQPPS